VKALLHAHDGTDAGLGCFLSFFSFFCLFIDQRSCLFDIGGSYDCYVCIYISEYKSTLSKHSM
jgi:hypothetical protein